jgi:hypothetical protein
MMDEADGAPGHPLAVEVDRRIRDDNGNTAEMNRTEWIRSAETRDE